jgi:hypothetical protein
MLNVLLVFVMLSIIMLGRFTECCYVQHKG